MRRRAGARRWTLRSTAADFLLAVLIAMRRETNSGTQCDAQSAAISLAVLAFGPFEQEVCRRAHRARVRESEGFHTEV